MQTTEENPEPRSRRAPTDAAWRESFVLAARGLDVPGSAIADALAQVEDHVAESQESTYDGFGDPCDYARALAAALPAQPHSLLAGAGATIGGTVVVGTGLLLGGLTAIADGADASYSWGAVLSAALVTAIAAGLGRAMRGLGTPSGRLRLGALGAFGLAAAALAPVLVPAEAVALPAVLATLVGVVLLTVSGVLLTRSVRRDRDLLLDPRTGRQVEVGPRWLAPLAVGVPVVLLLALVASIVLPRLG